MSKLGWSVGCSHFPKLYLAFEASKRARVPTVKMRFTFSMCDFKSNNIINSVIKLRLKTRRVFQGYFYYINILEICKFILYQN